MSMKWMRIPGLWSLVSVPDPVGSVIVCTPKIRIRTLNRISLFGGKGFMYTSFLFLFSAVDLFGPLVYNPPLLNSFCIQMCFLCNTRYMLNFQIIKSELRIRNYHFRNRIRIRILLYLSGQHGSVSVSYLAVYFGSGSCW